MYSCSVTPVVSALLLATALFAQTQPSASSPRRDATAIAVVQQSLGALAAVGTVAEITSVTVTGSSEPLAPSTAPSATFTFQVQGGEFNESVQSGGHSSTFASGHGHPWTQLDSGAVEQFDYYMARAHPPFYMPALVLAAALNNANVSIQGGEVKQVGARSAIHVHIEDDSDLDGQHVSQQDWYFDPTTALPLHVDYRVPTNRNAAEFRAGGIDFSSYKPFSGIQVPTVLTVYDQQAPSASASIQSVVFNQLAPAATFDAPGVKQ